MVTSTSRSPSSGDRVTRMVSGRVAAHMDPGIGRVRYACAGRDDLVIAGAVWPPAPAAAAERTAGRLVPRPARLRRAALLRRPPVDGLHRPAAAAAAAAGG